MTKNLRDVQASPTYLNLKQSKRAFVTAMIQNGGNKIAAAKAATDHDITDDYAQRKAYGFLKDFAVATLLSATGEEIVQPLLTPTQMMRMVSQRLRNPSMTTAEFIRLTELYQKMLDEKPKRKKPATITDKVLEMEKRQ